jgi:phosphopantetheine adenylyltransferase
MNNELDEIKEILKNYQNKIKDDEKKIIEMNNYLEQIQKYLAKQKKQLREIYEFVDNYGILMKKQEDSGISPTLDEFLGGLEQIKADFKKLL